MNTARTMSGMAAPESSNWIATSCAAPAKMMGPDAMETAGSTMRLRHDGSGREIERNVPELEQEPVAHSRADRGARAAAIARRVGGAHSSSLPGSDDMTSHL